MINSVIACLFLFLFGAALFVVNATAPFFPPVIIHHYRFFCGPARSAAAFPLIIRQQLPVHGEGYPVAHVGGVVADAL